MLFVKTNFAFSICTLVFLFKGAQSQFQTTLANTAGAITNSAGNVLKGVTAVAPSPANSAMYGLTTVKLFDRTQIFTNYALIPVLFS